MIYPGSYQNVAGTAQLFAAGAAPKTVNGVTVVGNLVKPGSLSALVVAAAKTNTTTITAKWQVSADNSTWVDFTPMNNAANVTMNTGNGTTQSVTRALAAPDGISAWPFARVQLVTGVSTADGTDDGGTISYRWLVEGS